MPAVTSPSIMRRAPVADLSKTSLVPMRRRRYATLESNRSRTRTICNISRCKPSLAKRRADFVQHRPQLGPFRQRCGEARAKPTPKSSRCDGLRAKFGRLGRFGSEFDRPWPDRTWGRRWPNIDDMLTRPALARVPP